MERGNLIICRNVGESIVIGDDIEVTFVELRKGGRIRLGIRAPKNVVVHRLEIAELIQRQREHDEGGEGGGLR